MKPTQQGFILESGREVRANQSILGLGPERSPENGKLVINQGYDGCVQGDDVYNDEENKFTREEKREIALYMITLWNEWALQE